VHLTKKSCSSAQLPELLLNNPIVLPFKKILFLSLKYEISPTIGTCVLSSISDLNIILPVNISLANTVPILTANASIIAAK